MQMSFKGRELAEEGIKRATRHANPHWMDACVLVGEQLAKTHRFVTSADIDLVVMKKFPSITTHEKRAMAGVMRRLVKRKVLEPTSDFVPDPRANCHCNPIRVWRSLVYMGFAA